MRSVTPTASCRKTWPRGFRLTGRMETTGVFEPRAEEDTTPAESTKWLWRQAREGGKALLRSLVARENEQDIAQTVMEATMTEVENG